MIYSFILMSLLIFYQIREYLACWWGGTQTDVVYKNIVNKAKGKKLDPPEFWSIPGSTKIIYKNWIQAYMANLANKTEYETHGEPPEGMSIPGTWKGYGAGHGGQAPPPWAIVAEAYGKPDFCFYEPKEGPCRQKLKRWGFNSYYGTCHKFNYSGCMGNENNFHTKKRCEEACLKQAQSNCQKYVAKDYEYDVKKRPTIS